MPEMGVITTILGTVILAMVGAGTLPWKEYMTGQRSSMDLSGGPDCAWRSYWKYKQCRHGMCHCSCKTIMKRTTGTLLLAREEYRKLRERTRCGHKKGAMRRIFLESDQFRKET